MRVYVCMCVCVCARPSISVCMLNCFFVCSIMVSLSTPLQSNTESLYGRHDRNDDEIKALEDRLSQLLFRLSTAWSLPELNSVMRQVAVLLGPKGLIEESMH